MHRMNAIASLNTTIRTGATAKTDPE